MIDIKQIKSHYLIDCESQCASFSLSGIASALAISGFTFGSTAQNARLIETTAGTLEHYLSDGVETQMNPEVA